MSLCPARSWLSSVPGLRAWGCPLLCQGLMAVSVLEASAHPRARRRSRCCRTAGPGCRCWTHGPPGALALALALLSLVAELLPACLKGNHKFVTWGGGWRCSRACKLSFPVVCILQGRHSNLWYFLSFLLPPHPLKTNTLNSHTGSFCKSSL